MLGGGSLSDKLSGLRILAIGDRARSVSLHGPSASMRWLMSGLCGASLLAGCVQGPDYVKPQVAVPPAYRYAEHAAAPDATTMRQAWWSGFGDPALNALVAEALMNNRDLRIAAARVDEFAAILAGTKSQGRPQIGYGLSGNRSRASEQKIPDFVDPLSSTFSAVLSASWEIDLWGRIRRETEAARANLLASEEARRGVTLTLISSVHRQLRDFAGSR